MKKQKRNRHWVDFEELRCFHLTRGFASSTSFCCSGYEVGARRSTVGGRFAALFPVFAFFVYSQLHTLFFEHERFHAMKYKNKIKFKKRKKYRTTFFFAFFLLLRILFTTPSFILFVFYCCFFHILATAELREKYFHVLCVCVCVCADIKEIMLEL